MARERAKLTDKQERILVQAQLMGLTPHDMQQISNRLIALEKEATWKREVAAACQDLHIGKSDKGWIITDNDGKIYNCVKVPKARNSRSWYESNSNWEVHISKPTTRFKERTVKDVAIYVDQYIPARLCPENNKELYGLMLGIKNGRIS